METEEMLDWMLEEAKKKPMNIRHEFDYRVDIWIERILPQRLTMVRQAVGDTDFVHRMIRLTLADGMRLRERAIHEEGVGSSTSPLDARLAVLLYVVAKAIEAYLNEVRR